MILNMASDDDNPRAPYKAHEGGELKVPTQRSLRHAERNSNSPNPNRIVTSSLGTFWTALLYDPAFEGHVDGAHL